MKDAFDIGQVDRTGVLRQHRLAMGDCILAWATFESLFRAMLTSVEQRPLNEGAQDYHRLWPQRGWPKLRQAMRDRGASPEVLDVIKRHEKDFETHIAVRNYIAHAGCVGTWLRDPDYLVFAPFEPEGAENLAVVLWHMTSIERSTRWARSAAAMANRIMNAGGY